MRGEIRTLPREIYTCNKFILKVFSKYCWEYSREQETALISFSLKVKEGFSEVGPFELFAFHANHKACPSEELCTEEGNEKDNLILSPTKTNKQQNYHRHQGLFPDDITFFNLFMLVAYSTV